MFFLVVITDIKTALLNKRQVDRIWHLWLEGTHDADDQFFEVGGAPGSFPTNLRKMCCGLI